MATYLILNLVVLGLVVAAVALLRVRLPWRRVALIMGIMLVLTAVFDTLIIGNRIVAYDSSKLLGLFVGRAPVEDFAYTVVAAIIVPAIWLWLGREK